LPADTAFILLDDEHADLGTVAGTIFNVRSGELDQELDDLIEPLGGHSRGEPQTTP
jgi:hypothetical protein